jgi:FAD synthetase
VFPEMDIGERVEAYIVNVEKALRRIDRGKLGDHERKLLEIAEAYLHDAKYYFEKKDYFTSLACIAYAEGLIDSLRYLGITSFEWEPLSKLLSRPKVLVAGGFEILHPGHIYLFEKAWELGRVYVIVARDKSFPRFKKRESIIPEEQRRRVVESVRYVYKAVLGDEEDYLKPVVDIKPDIILLGPDQWPNEEELKKELRERGLGNVIIKRLDKRINGSLYSASMIIKKILETHGCLEK